MIIKKLYPDRVVGLISALVGAAAVLESWRIYEFRVTGLTGDHIFSAMIGCVLLLLGGVLAFTGKAPTYKVEYPQGQVRRRMIATMVLLFAYVLLLHFIGYTISTFFVFAALFRVFGGYSWTRCTLMSGVMTAILSLVFIYWLVMPFPTGELFKLFYQ